MSLEQLEKLAANPFYTLSDEQIAQLEEYRKQKFEPFEKQSLNIKKHNTYFKKTKN
jgi:hypothetical protein